MATRIYKINKIQTVDGKSIEIYPLKLKYLHDFMETFDTIKDTKTEDEAIEVLVKCARVAMEQFYPEIAETTDQIEDNFDLPTIYNILDYAGNIKINSKDEKPVKQQATEDNEKNEWKNFDLLKLETEVFMFGIWKNFEELETSISLPELVNIISIHRDLDYKEKKFLAAIQGVDLDKQTGASKGQKEWEDMKARVFSKGKATDSKDILALQGQNAKQAGFGIGMGLQYEDLRSSPNKK
jgi:hypothetical protein